MRWRKQATADAATDDWAVLQGQTSSGAPLIIRVNRGLDGQDRAALPVRLGTKLEFSDPRPDGFYGDGEAEPLASIEDSLVDAIGADGALALIVTGAGAREFVSYVRDEETALAVVARVAEGVDGYTVQRNVARDPEWALYERFRQ